MKKGSTLAGNRAESFWFGAGLKRESAGFWEPEGDIRSGNLGKKDRPVGGQGTGVDVMGMALFASKRLRDGERSNWAGVRLAKKKENHESE